MQEPTVLAVGNGAVIRAYEEAGVKVSAAQLPEYIVLPRMDGYGSLNIHWDNNLPYPLEVTCFALIEGKNSDITGWQKPRNVVIQITNGDDNSITLIRDADALTGAVIPSGGKIQIEVNNSSNFDYINIQSVTLRRCAVVSIQAWNN